jgi:multidrug efflux system outer membrane protein
VLLGRSPKEIYDISLPTAFAEAAATYAIASTNSALSPSSVPSANSASLVVVPTGLPSDLLLRRPDIVAAEQRLIAMNARIAQARASLFPAISLTGMLGSESASLSDLFTGPAGIWSLAAGVLQPIFAGGRLRAGVEAAESRERQALIQYQQTIQGAFKEVRDAIDGQILARQQLESETRRAESLRDTYRLARLRYDNGVTSQLDVLDAERSLLAAELNRADALRAQRAAVADLFKALGGGWDASNSL